MHGLNVLRAAERRSDGKLQVHKIWRTIQGEGPFAGVPAVFIRLTGCNLACTFCDTKWDDEHDKYMTVGGIVELVRIMAQTSLEDPTRVIKLVVITGGEPLRQDLRMLVAVLIGDGFTVQIETAGTYWQDWMTDYDDPPEEDQKLVIVCSPKTAHVHKMIHATCRHWKYVIQYDHQSIYDGLPVGGTQHANPDLARMAASHTKFGDPARVRDVVRRAVTIWVSPCDDGDPLRNRRNMKAAVDAAMKYGYRVTLQMQKILEMP
jgi:7-carboxy-7-deazaguanine synthase